MYDALLTSGEPYAVAWDKGLNVAKLGEGHLLVQDSMDLIVCESAIMVTKVDTYDNYVGADYVVSSWSHATSYFFSPDECPPRNQPWGNQPSMLLFETATTTLEMYGQWGPYNLIHLKPYGPSKQVGKMQMKS